MDHGGYRKGAGRKPGSKTTKRAEEAIKAAEEGITPLAYMLSVLRNEAETPERRSWAAEKAAPYMHPRLQTTTVKGEGEGGAVKLLIANA
mgnify:CR=1 FL=1